MIKFREYIFVFLVSDKESREKGIENVFSGIIVGKFKKWEKKKTSRYRKLELPPLGIQNILLQVTLYLSKKSLR